MKIAMGLSTIRWIPVTILCTVLGCTSGSDDTLSMDTADSIDPGQENLISYPANAEPLYDIELIKEVEYGEVVEFGAGEGAIIFGNLAVDDQGRLYGAGGDRTFPVFQPDGSHLTTLGGTGSGPGEFRAPHNLLKHRIQGDQLTVYDGTLQRIIVYSLETLKPIHHLLISPDNWEHIGELDGLMPDEDEIYPLNDSTLVIGFSGPIPLDTQSRNVFQFNRFRYYKMDMEGQIVSDMLYESVYPASRANTNPDGRLLVIGAPISSSMPFIVQPKFTVDGDGFIYTADTGSLLITVRDPDGEEVLRTIHHPFERSAVDLEAFIRLRSITNPSYFDSIEVPDTWPAINSFFVDDEKRIWVATIIDDEDHFEWWVLSEEGELLARFPWDGSRGREYYYLGGIKTVKDGYLYTTEIIDEELRILQNVRYRIELTEK